MRNQNSYLLNDADIELSDMELTGSKDENFAKASVNAGMVIRSLLRFAFSGTGLALLFGAGFVSLAFHALTWILPVV